MRPHGRTPCSESPAELIDKITILTIKAERISDPQKEVVRGNAGRALPGVKPSLPPFGLAAPRSGCLDDSVSPKTLSPDRVIQILLHGLQNAGQSNDHEPTQSLIYGDDP